MRSKIPDVRETGQPSHITTTPQGGRGREWGARRSRLHWRVKSELRRTTRAIRCRCRVVAKGLFGLKTFWLLECHERIFTLGKDD